MKQKTGAGELQRCRANNPPSHGHSTAQQPVDQTGIWKDSDFQRLENTKKPANLR